MKQPQTSIMVTADDAPILARLVAVVKDRRVAAFADADRVHAVPADEAQTILLFVHGAEFRCRHAPARAAQRHLMLALGFTCAILP